MVPGAARIRSRLAKVSSALREIVAEDLTSLESVMRALAKDPGARPATAQVFLAELDAALAEDRRGRPGGGRSHHDESGRSVRAMRPSLGAPERTPKINASRQAACAAGFVAPNAEPVGPGSTISPTTAAAKTTVQSFPNITYSSFWD